jgi:hypothetical protein
LCKAKGGKEKEEGIFAALPLGRLCFLLIEDSKTSILLVLSTFTIAYSSPLFSPNIGRRTEKGRQHLRSFLLRSIPEYSFIPTSRPGPRG